MSTKELIAVNEFCTHNNIEIRFIHSLQESGLIELTTIQEGGFIHTNQLQQLEKWVRLYYEMDINLEGIETITHLLERINNLQEEITGLKNRLRLYEMNE
jgi:MerR HTH family regulatory protein